jgi:hypothetical protein
VGEDRGRERGEKQWERIEGEREERNSGRG